MTDDFQLLRQYAQGSESAFGELVSRYVNLVYSAALRQTGNVEDAQDVAQTVFTALARKARTLPHDVVLGGWLYRHTCFAAAQTMRTERRRQARERQTVTMDELSDRSETDWERLAPVLDDAMRSLGGADRDAIVLRYFAKRDLQGVGAALGISQEAARKRVTRALEKLRAQLARKGVTSTAAALALTLAGNAITAAPAGFAATLTSTSLAGVAAAGTTFSIPELTIMTKLQAAIISALVVAATVTPLLIQHQAQTRLREKNQMLEQQADRLAQLVAENERLSNLVANASRPVANDQLNELMRLRGQMGALRRQANELGELQDEESAAKTGGPARSGGRCGHSGAPRPEGRLRQEFRPGSGFLCLREPEPVSHEFRSNQPLLAGGVRALSGALFRLGWFHPSHQPI